LKYFFPGHFFPTNAFSINIYILKIWIFTFVISLMHKKCTVLSTSIYSDIVVGRNCVIEVNKVLNLIQVLVVQYI